jgi:hypothetical protein
VVLEQDAPQATALNTGVPTGFPRINGYVLIPNETGAVVCMVVWLGVEGSAYPKRTGLKDLGLVDLPFPSRKMTLTPLGTLVAEEQAYKLERGVSTFPSVGDPVLLPTARQLKSIIEASSEVDRRVTIGTSPLAADAAVTVNPDKVFGRHLAVLGNTGSGKSCTVAGLIRWSLEQAECGRKDGGRPNARFIVLDPNGEYSAAFKDWPDIRRFQISPTDGAEQLALPAWMWNSHEWCAFTHAAPGVQRPLLLQALRDRRAGAQLREPADRQAARLLRTYKASIEERISRGTTGFQGFPESKNCGNQLARLEEDARTHAGRAETPTLQGALSNAATLAKLTADRRHWKTANSEGYNDFSETELRAIVDCLAAALNTLPDLGKEDVVSEDAPVPFDVGHLADHLDQVAAQTPGGQASQLVQYLSLRIRMLLQDSRVRPVVNPSGNADLAEWLKGYIGDDGAANGNLVILDLSLASSEVLHLLIAVAARVIFEAAQRFRKLTSKELPTVLVLEEAHTFIRRGSDEEPETPTAAQMCRQTFERIAREGRKFGLGLVLSSQRPSEPSPTVLAQCNTFLLHRIVNDKDQELVGKLVPDTLGGLLKDLPSLPSRQAILLGWATEIPTLIEISELPEDQRPQSSDPRFWDVWTGREPRAINWPNIANDWAGTKPQIVSKPPSTPPPEPEPNRDPLDDIPF